LPQGGTAHLIDAAKPAGRLGSCAARTIAAQRRSAVAEERDRTSLDVRRPSPHDDLAEVHRCNCCAFGRYFGNGARSRAEQAEAEDGAAMRINSAG